MYSFVYPKQNNTKTAMCILCRIHSQNDGQILFLKKQIPDVNNKDVF